MRLWRVAGEKPTYRISSTLFLRGLGVIYLIAFFSLWIQVDGLIGTDGILPAKNYLERVAGYYETQSPTQSPYWEVPTLAWLGSSNTQLETLCVIGMLGSLLLIFGFLPLPSLVLLWACYLSLFHVGQVFLSFQWDILLLETGFLAIFLAPLIRSRCFTDRAPPRIALWLLWWLLFRLMFESGVVKLSWNDGGDISLQNTWETLTALDFHYWTQPLPLPTAWYAQQLPDWFQKLAVIFVFAIELCFPFFIFAPPRMRRVASAGFIFLMFAIGVTGNYTFFNLLTILLAILLIDDACWPTRFRLRMAGTPTVSWVYWQQIRTYFLLPLTALAILIGSLQIYVALWPKATWSRETIVRFNPRQWLLVNSYGLFRQMTEKRPEIILEGSRDGKTWEAYNFCFKPGDLQQRPRVAAPHQPRLDWQMWFEALRWERVYQTTGKMNLRYASPWFVSLVQRLLENQPAVTGLLCVDRLAQSPSEPSFFRIGLYQYRFTDRAESLKNGSWWHRDLDWMSPTYRVSKTRTGILDIHSEENKLD